MADLYQFPPMLGPAEEYPVGSVEWAERISNRLQTGTRFISRHTAQHIGETAERIWMASPKPWEVWPKEHPFRTPDDYFKAVTGFEWKALRTVLEKFARAPEIDAALARAQAEHKGPGGNPYQIRYGGKLSEKGGDGGTSAAYLLRRLARDRPDILDAYERGEFKSARAAARAAGLVKEETAYQKILRLLPRLSQDEIADLCVVLANEYGVGA